VKICAAHTTLSVDAEWAILSIRQFMLGVLHDKIPCKRVEDGARGEEMWLFDHDIAKESEFWGRAIIVGTPELKYQYSVLAPVKVIEEGRREVLDMLGDEGRGRPAGVV